MSTRNSADARFSRRHRLTLQRDFRSVFREGRRMESDYAVILQKPNSIGRGRLGIIMKRSVGSAVQRNRVKRLIREWFRSGPKNLPIDTVIIPKPTMTTLSDLRQTTRLLTERIGHSPLS